MGVRIRPSDNRASATGGQGDTQGGQVAAKDPACLPSGKLPSTTQPSSCPRGICYLFLYGVTQTMRGNECFKQADTP